MKARLFLVVCFYVMRTTVSSAQTDTLYWENGKIQEIRNYEDADSYSVQRFHSNGQLHYEGHIDLWPNLNYRPEIITAFDWSGVQTIENGDGDLFTYYENGTIREKGSFKGRGCAGDYEEYYPNGTLKCIGNYGRSPGSIHHKQGKWQYFDSTGTLFEEKNWVNGHEYFLNYWEDGKQLVKNGKGTMRLYYDSGTLKAEGEVKEGKRWKKWMEYDPAGNISSKLKYVEWKGIYSNEIRFKQLLLETVDSSGNISGKRGNGYKMTYRNNGSPEIKEYFLSNRRDSVYTFYPSGNIFKKIVVEHSHTDYEKTIEVYYPNQICASKRINPDEYHYWDRNGNLKTISIDSYDFESGIQTFFITEFYPNGTKKEFKTCKIKEVTNEFGEILLDETCSSIYWDENGKELEKE